MGPHEIAAYVRELEEKAGEPLSAAVAQPTDGPGASEPAPPAKIDTRPGHTPPPARMRTGPRPALELPSEPAASARRPERPPPKAAEPEPAAADDLGGPTFTGAETPPTERPHPAPTAPRPAARRTGTRQALDPAALGASTARPPTSARRTGTRQALDPSALGASARPPTAAPPRARPSAQPEDDDEGESTELGLDPPPRMRSNPRAAAVNISADATLPPRTPAFRDAEPTPTPAVLPPPRRAKKEPKSGSGLGTWMLVLVLVLGGVAAVGYLMGVRPADFRGVHSFGALEQVLITKLSDKPAPKPAEGPLAKPPPPAPQAPLLPPAVTPEQAAAPSTPPAVAPSSAAPPARPAVAEKPSHPAEGEARHRPSKPASKPAAAQPAPEQPEPAPEPAQPEIGSVTFTIKPWANVTVNGKQLGASPLPTEAMAAGSYTAEFSNPAVDHVIKRSFTVTPGAHLEIVVDMAQK